MYFESFTKLPILSEVKVGQLCYDRFGSLSLIVKLDCSYDNPVGLLDLQDSTVYPCKSLEDLYDTFGPFRACEETYTISNKELEEL